MLQGGFQASTQAGSTLGRVGGVPIGNITEFTNQMIMLKVMVKWFLCLTKFHAMKCIQCIDQMSEIFVK
jgi:hypothetical protein